MPIDFHAQLVRDEIDDLLKRDAHQLCLANIARRIAREAAERPARKVNPFVPNGLTIEYADNPADLLFRD